MTINSLKIAFIGSETTFIQSLISVLENTEGFVVVGFYKDMREAEHLLDDPSVYFILSYTNIEFEQIFLKNLKKHPVLTQKLTNREELLMELLAKGLVYKEIAGELNVTLGTVKQYVHILYEKLGVSNRTEAINKYFERRP